MSLLSRSHLRVALAPDRVTAVFLSQARPARVQKTGVWVCQPLPTDTQPWQAAVRAMALGLAELKVGGARATVVLSSHFVRYIVLPWSDQVVGPAERQAMARISFEKHFGPSASGWTVRLAEDEHGKAALGSAVDEALPGAILQACRQAGVKPVSVQPYLMSVFNQHRRQLAPGNLCLVVLEPHKVSLLMASAGEWHAVRILPLRQQSVPELESLVRREMLLAGLSLPVRLYLYAPEGAPVTVPTAPDLPTQVLAHAATVGLSSATGPEYAMAMSGAA